MRRIVIFLLLMHFFSPTSSLQKVQAEQSSLTDAILPHLDVATATQFYDMFTAVDTLFTQEGIFYWAAFGTLLGAVRHHGIIPWDDDLDLAIFDYDLGKVLQLKDSLAAKGLVLYSNQDYIKIYLAQGKVILKADGTPLPWKYPFIDIFPMGLFDGKVSYLSERLRLQLGEKEWIEPSSLEKPLQKVSFGPFLIPIPYGAHHYLERIYGSDYLEVAYADYDHSSEVKREKIKVTLVDRSPAPYRGH